MAAISSPSATLSPSSPTNSSLHVAIVAMLLLLAASLSAPARAESSSYEYPPLVPELSFSFYDHSCPNLESIVRNFLRKSFKTNIGLAAGLLRLHFHDCFVQGCDASILLDGTANHPSEQQDLPNLTLRPAAFKAINDLRALIDQSCGHVVSCADVVTIAARDSVYLSGGPEYKVPLGRRDSLTFASPNVTLASLPPPTSNVSHLLSVLGNLGLDATDLVTLSGGHTIGLAHCTSFTNRLYPTQDSTINKAFAAGLRVTCPAQNTTNTTVNDIRTPNAFDNKYYVDLLDQEGLFTSDEGLYFDKRTSATVVSFAGDQSLFFDNFVYSIVKMGQLSVLTGSKGEIRTNCSAPNAKGVAVLQSVVEGGDGETRSGAAF